MLTTYSSAHSLASSSSFSSLLLSRAEYNESGSNAAFRKFPDWKSVSNETAPPPAPSSKWQVVEEEEYDEAPTPPVRGRAKQKAGATPNATIGTPKGVGRGGRRRKGTG